MKIIGLTGSIAMGKSTTAVMFRRFGVPVNDADAAVHDLYRGAAVAPIREAFPEAVVDDRVDRTILARLVLKNSHNLRRLESIVHPLVEAQRHQFVEQMEAAGYPICLVDIPLLFEIGGEDIVDIIVVVSAPAEVQRERALARPGMTVEKFEAIKARQIDDSVKRQRAHYVVETGYGKEHAYRQVSNLLRALT